MSKTKNERIYVTRPYAMNSEQLTEHIKAVGRAIIAEAESLGADPHKRYLEFNAMVSPGDVITTVKVTYEVYADPNVHINEWAEQEKAREEDDT